MGGGTAQAANPIPITDDYRSPSEMVTPFGAAPLPANYRASAEELPPPAPRARTVNEPAASAHVTDPLSFGGDIVETFQQAPTLKDKATTLLDIASMPLAQNRNIIGQHVRDDILYDDPYKTQGGYGLGDIVAHPEKAPQGIGVALATLELPDWVPSDVSQGIYSYYENNPEARAAADKAYEETGDIGVYVDLYNESESLTLESGGVGGLVRGLIRQAGSDPLLIPSLVGNAAARPVIEGLEATGRVGAARALSVPIEAANAIIDPSDLAIRGAGKLVPFLAPNAKTARNITGEAVAESVYTGTRSVQDARANANYGAEAPLGTHGPAVPEGYTAPVYEGPPVPEGYAPPVYEGPPVPEGYTAPVYEGPPVPEGYNPADPSGEAAKIEQFYREYPEARAIADAAYERTRDNRAYLAVYKRAMDARAEAAKKAAGPVRPPRTKEVGGAGGSVGLNKTLVFDGTKPPGSRVRWQDGTSPGAPDFAVMDSVLRKVDPSDLYPGQYGEGMNQYTMMRSAMTDAKYMLDDWPTGKFERLRLTGKAEDRAAANAAVAGAKRWKELTVARLQPVMKGGFGERELQRLVDNLQNRIRRESVPIEDVLPDGTVNYIFPPVGSMDNHYNRVQALFEAARDAGITKDVEIYVNGVMMRKGGEGGIVRGRVFGSPIAGDEFWRRTPTITGDRVNGFSVPPTPAEYQRYFDVSLGVEDANTWTMMYRMIQDPDAKMSRPEIMRALGAGEISPARATQLQEYVTVRHNLHKNKKISEHTVDVFWDEWRRHTSPEPIVELPVSPERLDAELPPAPGPDAPPTGDIPPTDTTPPPPTGRPWEPASDPWTRPWESGWSDEHRIEQNYPQLAGLLEIDTPERRKGFWERARTKAKYDSSRLSASGKIAYNTAPEEKIGYGAGIDLMFRSIDERAPIIIDGQRKPILSMITDTMDDLDRLHEHIGQVDPNDKRLSREIALLAKRYQANMGDGVTAESLTPDDIRRITTEIVVEKWLDSQPKLPESARTGIAGEIGRVVQNVVNFRRGVGLTNWAAAARQILNQFTGNAFGLFMAKPSALVDMGNLNQAKLLFQKARGKDAETATERVLRLYGGGGMSSLVSSQQKTMAFHNAEASGALGKLQDIVAPRFLRDAVAAPDEQAKHVVFNAEFRKIRQEVEALPEHFRRTSSQMNVRREGLGVVAARAERAMPEILRKFQTPYSRTPVFTGEELERGILDYFENDIRRGTVNRDSVKVLADRMKRDWNTVVNSQKQKANSEVKRVMFSWDNTRADDLIQNVFLYHYWATRAGFLYTKEMIKKPFIFNLYTAAANQMYEEADKGGYPDWLRGWTRLMNTPAGVTLFANPLDMVSTALHLAEWQGEASIDGTNPALTVLGQARGMIPFVWNPAIELILWGTGSFGKGAFAPSNMLGLNRLTSLGADLINLGTAHDIWPNGMFRDASGNPVWVKPRPVDDIILKVAQHFGVPVTPSAASFEKETQAYLYDHLLQQYPNTGPEDLVQMVDDIMQAAEGGVVAPELEAAQADAFANGMKGPEYDLLPEGLRPIFGAIQRYVSPVRITARSETGALIQYPDMSNTLPGNPKAITTVYGEAGEDSYDIKEVLGSLYQTNRSRGLRLGLNAYYDGLGDPELEKAVQGYWSVVNGQNTVIDVGGVHYTAHDLNAMSEGQRFDLADAYLKERGYDKAILDDLKAHKNEIIAANPDVGGYLEFENYAREYPGAEKAFVDEAVRTSPSYAAFMAGLKAPAGTEEYYSIGTSPDAYLALEGDRGSIYDAENIPPRGNIPGLPVGTNFVAKRAADEAIEALTKEPSSFDEFKDSVEKDVKQIYYAQEWLDINYPGLKAGDWLDKSIYTAMKDAGRAAPKPEDAGAAYEYYDWLQLNATSTDTSVEAFLNQRDYKAGTQNIDDLAMPTAEQIGEQRGYSVVPVEPASAQDLAKIGIMGNALDYTYLRSGPNPNNPAIGEMEANTPLKVVYKGGDWVQIMMATGQIGWVPASAVSVRN